jgi:hypothetical protein
VARDQQEDAVQREHAGQAAAVQRGRQEVCAGEQGGRDARLERENAVGSSNRATRDTVCTSSSRSGSSSRMACQERRRQNLCLARYVQNL